MHMASDRNGDRTRDPAEDADRDSASEDARGGDGKRSGPSPLANPWVNGGLIIIVLLLVAGGVLWWLTARNYEDTDDAFIDTHIIHVSPQIAGQLLVDIDARSQNA